MKCPKCEIIKRQYKVGVTKAGSQRYKCSACGHRYTPLRKHRGYAPEMHSKAIHLYVEGFGPYHIGRRLGVHHTTIKHWINSYLTNLPDDSIVLR